MPRFSYPRPLPSAITPESVYLNRRQVIGALGAFAAASAVPRTGFASALGTVSTSEFSTDEPLTSASVAKSYCNFFEFGTSKDDPKQLAHSLVTDPWSVEVGGLVHQARRFSLEEILTKFDLEERIYRLRCVEAWSMVIPWIGFPLKDLLAKVDPAGSAKFVEFETLYNPDMMPNQRSDILDWPYREGLRIDEAMHPLTILAVGMYGEVLPNQNGAPIRLIVPWKYGYKSIKSIVRINLMEEQPIGSWEARSPREYGFYANVLPHVRHPRWHQATERRLPGRGRIRTEMFNGYADLVEDLYRGMNLEEAL